MSTKLLPAVSLLFVAAAPAAPVASVSVDGVSCGSVLRWEGGDPRAEVVTINLATASGPGSKHIANVTYDPLLLEFSLPPPAPVVDWINDLNANGHSRKTVRLTDFDQAGAPTVAIEATGATLTEVRFPALDATAPGPAGVVLVIAPEQVRLAPALSETTTSGGGAKPAVSTSFQLKVDGLSGSDVIRIEPLKVSQSAPVEAVGETRIPTRSYGTTEFSNLTFTIADSGAAGWKAWFNDFAINGNNGDGSEKNGSIELSDATGKGVPFGLQFSHVGIVRVTRLSAAAGTTARDQVELYFEHMTVGALPTSAPSAADAAAAATTPPATTPGPAAGTPTATEPATEPATAPAAAADASAGAATPATIPGGGTMPTRSGTATTRLIPDLTAAGAPVASAVASRVPLPAAVLEPAANPAVTGTSLAAPNPADQGTRDPADFPRVTGLTRVSYSGTFQKTYTSESATYTSTEDVHKLMARISDAAQGAGWEQLTLAEQGAPPSGRTVSASWSKPQVQAQVSCSDRREGGTEVYVSVYKQKPAAN